MNPAPSQALADIADLNPRVELSSLRDDTVVSFIPMADVSDSGEWVNRQYRFLGEVRTGYTPFVEGDLLFAKITPCMENGKGAHARSLTNGVGLGSTEFHVLRAKGDNSSRFIFHWLQARPTRTRAIAFMGGSAGQQRVQAEFFSHYRIPVIAPTEQSRIATVLDSVDAAIAQTEALIAKLKQVRAGLLHDLLTRGLDEHGQLRDPVAHPEQFQDSPVGWIPREWDVQALGSAMAAIFDYRGRTPLKLNMEWGGGEIPALSANNVEMGRINFEKEAYFGSPALYKRWMTQGDVEQGDVLITMEAPLGNIAQVPDTRRYILSQRVVLLRPKPELIVKDFLALQMMGTRFQRDLVRHSTGTTAVGIQRAKLETIDLVAPRSHAEQQAIVEAVHSINTRIEAEACELQKVRSLKSGLMADLLTGRVRVPEDIEVRQP